MQPQWPSDIFDRKKKKKKQPAGKIIKQKATTHTMQDMEDVPRPRQNSIDATYF